MSLRSLPSPAAQRARVDAGHRRAQRHLGGGHAGPGVRPGRPGPPGEPPTGVGGHPDRRDRRPAGPRSRGRSGGAGKRRRTPVEVFPAWETLPFERVSPDVSTMGRRLRLLWQLGAGSGRTARRGGGAGQGRPPAPRPVEGAARPVVVSHGDRVGGRRAGGRTGGHGLPARVAGRAPWRAGGAGWDRRRLPVDRRRARSASTCGATRWTGSPGSTSADQRSIDDLGTVELFGCRELLPDRGGAGPGRRAGGLGAVGTCTSGSGWPRGSCSTAWSRGCPGCPTAKAPPRPPGRRGRWWCSSSPAGVRDRAGELNDEEAALAEALAVDLGRASGGDAEAPAAARPLRPAARARRRAPCSRWCPSAEWPDVPAVERRGWEPVLGDGAGWPARWRAGRGRLLGRAVPSSGRGRPSGWPACWPRRV